ncbi:hypothetical protein [Candidatus Viridilinea mediisalina]|uniref:Glycosyltransferase RgtA/B/C/D-like domain-containing protein n=1 Tax=Candidatus Viridilinea mediisalina TaxID=2024553 RepID=A0A2A6RMY9_9CHLR|nr:hypothetical protein [Candidatus Viridilinea mediisalina]PDW04444.1 hypothetical protein CJ255_03420 [Candidatus Viridilinea mediisalina]
MLSYLGVLGAYILLALWITWPMPLQFATHYYTSGNNIFYFPTSPDAPKNIWMLWWAGQALATGANPLFTPMIYHPQGLALHLQTYDTVAGIMTFPANLLFGPVAAYNFSALLGFILTGWFGFLLVRPFVQGVAPALLVGTLLTATPYHVAKYDAGQMNFVHMQWLVLFMAVLIHMTISRRWWGVPVAALAFLLLTFSDWYYTLVAVFFALMWGGLNLASRPQRDELFKLYGLSGGLAGLLLLPRLGALRASSGGQDAEASPMWAYYTQGYSADAFGFFFPNALHPLWAVPVERFLINVAPYGISEGSYTAAGWTLAGLALLGVAWYWRQQWQLLVVALIAWLFALGPTLFVLGYETGIAMPYQLLQLVPGLDTARRPNLFGLITIISAAIFAALALARLHEQLRPERYRLVLGLVALIALFELWPPQRVANALDQAPVYQRIAAEGAPGAVVDVPIEGGTDSRTLINQLVHQQPILRGYIARPPHYPTLLYSPLPKQLATFKLWPEADVFALDQVALEGMQCYYQFRYLVFKPALLTKRQHDALRSIVAQLGADPAQPWYADERHHAFRLPLHTDTCTPFVFLGEGWGEPEVHKAQVWRWSEGQSELYIVNPKPEPKRVKLQLLAYTLKHERSVNVYSANKLLTTLTLDERRRWYRLNVELEPGYNQFMLESATSIDPVSGRALGIALKRVEVH